MNYITRRLASLVPLLIVVTLLCFSMLKLLPGDPTVMILGPGASDPLRVAKLKHDLGLTRSFPMQYLTWLGRFFTGNFGNTYNTGGGGEPVKTAIARNYPVTLELVLWALLIAAAIAIVFGILGAYRSGTRTDRSLAMVTYAALSSPGFVIGPILIYLFAIRFQLFQVGQWEPWSGGIVKHIKSVVLPALTLGIGLFPNLSRVLRTDMESTLKEDFVTLAKAKGLSDRTILFRHAFRPSSLTLLTVAGINLGSLVSGAVIVERLFNLPGLGTLLIQAISQREYILVLGVVTLITIVILLVATLVDVLYGVIDPRIRVQRKAA